MLSSLRLPSVMPLPDVGGYDDVEFTYDGHDDMVRDVRNCTFNHSIDSLSPDHAVGDPPLIDLLEQIRETTDRDLGLNPAGSSPPGPSGDAPGVDSPASPGGVSPPAPGESASLPGSPPSGEAPTGSSSPGPATPLGSSPSGFALSGTAPAWWLCARAWPRWPWWFFAWWICAGR